MLRLDDWVVFAMVPVGLLTTACGSPSTAGGVTATTTSAVTSPATITPAVTPQGLPIEQVLTGATPLSGQPPDYGGIVPGKSTRADVVAKRGPPNVARRYQDFESLHYFTNGKEYFLLRNGSVEAVTSNKLGGFSVSEDLEKKFPAAMVLTPNFGPPTRALPTLGLAFSLYAYQFLKPMTLDEYIALWDHFPLDVDPFPVIPSVEAIGIAPGRTTRSEVESLLGPPDRKVTENRNAPWLYDVEPDLLGRLKVFFDEADKVKNMDISESRSRQLYTFENTVEQYGEPDLIQVIPGMEAGGQMTQALLYLQRGLRVGAGCFGPACSVVERQTPVSQKWYFQPSTIDEYRKDFTNSQFVPWHGFDK